MPNPSLHSEGDNRVGGQGKERDFIGARQLFFCPLGKTRQLKNTGGAPKKSPESRRATTRRLEKISPGLRKSIQRSRGEEGTIFRRIYMEDRREGEAPDKLRQRRNGIGKGLKREKRNKKGRKGEVNTEKTSHRRIGVISTTKILFHETRNSFCS